MSRLSLGRFKPSGDSDHVVVCRVGVFRQTGKYGG
jgi:hypothetical protein